MRSLNTYLTENIYSNLGIDDEIAFSEVREWCKSYARAIGLSNTNKIFAGTHTSGWPIINSNTPQYQGDFVIDTDPKYNLAPGGELPNYCKSLAFEPKLDFDILVKSNPKNPLKNFNNTPLSIDISKNCISVKSIILTGDYDTIDFDNIKCGVTLKIRNCNKIKQIKNIHDFEGLYLDVNSIADATDVLNSFTGCKLKKDPIIRLYIPKISGDLTVSGKQLEAYTKAAVRLGFINSISFWDVTDVLKRYKLHAYLKAKYTTLWLEQFNVTDCSFLKTLDPVYDVVAFADNGREISESELRDLPAGIILYIESRKAHALYDKYSTYDFINVYTTINNSVLIMKK